MSAAVSDPWQMVAYAASADGQAWQPDSEPAPSDGPPPPVDVTPRRYRDEWMVEGPSGQIYENALVRVCPRTSGREPWLAIVDRIVWRGTCLAIATTRRPGLMAETVPQIPPTVDSTIPGPTDEPTIQVSTEPTPVVETLSEPEVPRDLPEEPKPLSEAPAVTTRQCGRRPRPIVRVVGVESLAWEPTKRECYYDDGGSPGMMRSGEQFALCRDGVPFPLGHASDHRRVQSHNRTRQSILNGPCLDPRYPGRLTPGPCYVSGPGYHVVQTWHVRRDSGGGPGVLRSATVDGVYVVHRLVVVNDHTGKGAMRASLVCFVGLDAVGAVAVARARHVAGAPERWLSDLDAMIETAILSQDEILELLRWAAAHSLTQEDRNWLKKRGVHVKYSARTALDAFRAWHGGSGGRARPTWGVWARRLDNQGLKHMAALRGQLVAVVS